MPKLQMNLVWNSCEPAISLLFFRTPLQLVPCLFRWDSSGLCPRQFDHQEPLRRLRLGQPRDFTCRPSRATRVDASLSPSPPHTDPLWLLEFYAQTRWTTLAVVDLLPKLKRNPLQSQWDEWKFTRVSRYHSFATGYTAAVKCLRVNKQHTAANAAGDNSSPLPKWKRVLRKITRIWYQLSDPWPPTIHRDESRRKDRSRGRGFGSRRDSSSVSHFSFVMFILFELQQLGL
jgi:hypothetical protein